MYIVFNIFFHSNIFNIFSSIVFIFSLSTTKLLISSNNISNSRSFTLDKLNQFLA